MNKRFLIRWIVMGLMIALMILMLYLILVTTLPDLFSVIKTGDLHRIQRYLKHQSTAEGLLCAGLLQVLQVWTIVITATPMQVAAGIVFGVLPSFLVCSAATVLGLAVSFALWKKLGHVLEKIMPLSEKEEQMIRNTLKKDVPPENLLFVLCFLFVMPNGLIPILASRMKISLPRFAASVAPGISFNVLVCTLIGDRLLDGDWFMMAGVILLSFGLVSLFWKLQETLPHHHHGNRS